MGKDVPDMRTVFCQFKISAVAYEGNGAFQKG